MAPSPTCIYSTIGRLMSDGVYGYAGGMQELLKTSGVAVGSYKARSLSQFSVWHVGGQSRYGQYRPQQFVVPVVERAVRGGACRLQCMVTESKSSGSVKCDSGLVGDPENLEAYIETVLAKDNKYGYYYRLLNPTHEVRNKTSESPCKVYLDFDIEKQEECKWQEAWEEVHVCIKMIKAALEAECVAAGLDHGDYSYVVGYGCRKLSGGKKKFSFHVVFTAHGFASPVELKGWLAAHLCGFGFDPKYDTKVYGRHALMRMNWCGKFGDVAAILLPCTFKKHEDGVWESTVTHTEFDSGAFHAFNINFYDHQKKEIALHIFKDKIRGLKNPCHLRVAEALGNTPAISPKDSYSGEMFAFFKPLLPEIKSAIQAHRLSIAESVGSGGVPNNPTTTPFVLQPCGDVDERIGIYHYKVNGDMFCEYDDPNFYHSSGPKTTIQINFIKGTYNQLCHACKPQAHQIRYYSLFELNRIKVRLFRADISDQRLELNMAGMPAIFAKYFAADLIFNPSICPTVIVYDSVNKLWIYSDRTKANVLGVKKEKMREAYVDYLTARHLASAASRKSNTDKKGKKAIDKEGKECSAAKAFGIPSNGLADAITACMGQTNGQILNPYTHLVPLADGQCYNIFTDELIPIRKDHYFSSKLNGRMLMKNADDPSIAFILAWFLEIAAGRPDLALYLQRLTGLNFTFFKFDRKFYVNCAPAGKNGKSVYRKMLQFCNTEPSASGQDRFANINNTFFCLANNANNAASAPRPDWFKMQHTTTYHVEELPAKKLDVDILKQVASFDERAARALYSNNIIDIHLRGRLMINTNYVPDLGETAPVWDRAVLLPWDTIYVDTKSEANPKKHRHLKNDRFIDELKTHNDAFITVCLRALHKFFKPHYKDGRLSISELTRPKCVVDYTETHRAKCMSVDIFVNKYMRRTEDHEDGESLNKAHSAYRQFLRDKGLTDLDFLTFCSKVAVHAYKTITNDCEDYFANLILTDEGRMMTNQQAPQGSIQNAFAQQQRRARIGNYDGVVHESPPPGYGLPLHTPKVHHREESKEGGHVRNNTCIMHPSTCDKNHV